MNLRHLITLARLPATLAAQDTQRQIRAEIKAFEGG
jgi:hypothetical protein